MDAVDLNFGCPQNIARKGRYGAFLMEEWDLISRLVRTLHEGLDVPVTCKIRMFPEREKTIEYAKMIEASGCQMLTVHGRTIKQKGQLSGLADWETIKAVKEALSIPVVANGNILYEEDVDECIRQTGVDGVMSAEANLTNPTVFSKGQHKVWEITEEYFDIAKVAQPSGIFYSILGTGAQACFFFRCRSTKHLGDLSKPTCSSSGMPGQSSHTVFSSHCARHLKPFP